MRGCIVTCDVHLERDAIREAFCLFEQLLEAEASALEPAPSQTTSIASASSSVPSTASAGDALQAELRALQEQEASTAPGPSGEGKNAAAMTKPFSVAQTGCNGNIFIRFSNDVPLSPVALVDRVFAKAKAGEAGGRAPHIIRMLPVSLTCPSSADISLAIAPLTNVSSAKGGLTNFTGTYRVEWRRRCNTDINKMAVIDAVAGAIQTAAPKATVDLSNAECAVVAEVIKTTCCLSVLPKWRENCGYNFRAACEAADKGQATSSVSG